MKCVPHKNRMFAERLQFIVYLLQTEEIYFQSEQVIMKCYYSFFSCQQEIMFPADLWQVTTKYNFMKISGGKGEDESENKSEGKSKNEENSSNYHWDHGRCAGLRM